MSIAIASDTFIRANQSGWGNASDTEAWTKAIGSVTASIASNKGQIATPTGSFVMLLGTGKINNGDFVVRFTPSSNGDYQGFTFAYVDSSDYCYTEVVNLAARVFKVVAGVATQIATSSVSITGGSSYWQHLNISGNVAKLRVWSDGSSEPSTWNTTATDSALSNIGQYGLHGFLNNSADTIGFDSFTVTGPQNTYYVDANNGNDSYPGNQYYPLATLTKAASLVTAGTSVYVQQGQYVLASGSQFISTGSGTPLAPILYQSVTQHAAKVISTLTQYVWQNSGDYVSISGFEITATDSGARIGIYNTGSYGSANYNLIHDLPASGSGSAGGGGIDHGNINALGNSAIGNIIYNVGLQSGSNSVHGIYLASGGGGNIYNNICYNNGAYGIQLWHGANAANVCNNLVFGNLYGGIIIGAVVGEGNGLNDNTVVANNIIAYNGIVGIHTIAGIRELGSTGTHNQYINNLVWQNATPQVSLQNGLVDVGTLTTDPLLTRFQLAGNGDYHPLPISPCINGGVSTNAPNSDAEQYIRPYPLTSGYDIGPYQQHITPNALALVRSGLALVGVRP